MEGVRKTRKRVGESVGCDLNVGPPKNDLPVLAEPSATSLFL